MRINGLNVKKEFDGDPSVETWFKAFLNNSTGNLTAQDNETVNGMAQSIIDAYKQAEEYEGPISKLKKDVNGNIILPEGTLLHATPPFIDKEKIIDYEKLSSISKNGLISLGMLDEDADRDDQEVPLQVSFHRCSKSLTCEEKMQEICRLNGLKTCGDIYFIVDVHNDGIKKLLSFNISTITDDDVDYWNGYRTEKNKFLAYRLKKYPEGIKTETEKQALGFLLDATRPPSNNPFYAYIPIAVPSKYITGIILPKQLENNENLINFLNKNFSNATLISSSGKAIDTLEREISL